MTKVIIESAINGSSIPTQSPYLPINANDIINHIIASYKAGAAIAYFHVRDVESNLSDKSISTFKAIMNEAKDQSDVVLCPALDFNGINEDSIEFLSECSPEMASFRLGPHIPPNFLLLKEFSSFKFSWEQDYLAQSYSKCEHFSYEVMEKYGLAMAEYKTRPQLEIHDTGEIDKIVWMLQKGIVARPLYLQFVLGKGVRLNADYLIYLYDSVKEKLGEFHFAVAEAGEEQMIMTSIGLALGGHVRVGLGDSVKNAGGELVKNSYDQVRAAREIIEGMGFEVATPDETRSILGLNFS